jgi:hypothetical protein
MVSLTIFGTDLDICQYLSSAIFVVTSTIDPDTIKMILTHSTLLDVKRELRPTANSCQSFFSPQLTTIRNQVLMIITQTMIFPQRSILKLQQSCWAFYVQGSGFLANLSQYSVLTIQMVFDI